MAERANPTVPIVTVDVSPTHSPLYPPGADAETVAPRRRGAATTAGNGAPGPAPRDLPFPRAASDMRRTPRRRMWRSANAAIAEEQAARILSTLGVDYTVWRDVATDPVGASSESKIDHIVLGPSGIFAVLSADWGAQLRLRKGELVGEGLGRGDKPIRTLYRRAQAFARTSGVRFSALMMVVPDDAVAAPMTVVRRHRGCPTLLVRQSWLTEVLRIKMGGMTVTSVEDLVDARARLGRVIHFVDAPGAGRADGDR